MLASTHGCTRHLTKCTGLALQWFRRFRVHHRATMLCRVEHERLSSLKHRGTCCQCKWRKNKTNFHFTTPFCNEMYDDYIMYIESGDSSVVTCWTVDQEVVSSNPTHGRNKICHALAVWVYSAHSIKWVPAFGGWGPPQSFDLKYVSMSFAEWLWYWLVIAHALGFKTIPDLLDTNSTHIGIVPTSPHHIPVTTWTMYAM